MRMGVVMLVLRMGVVMLVVPGGLGGRDAFGGGLITRASSSPPPTAATARHTDSRRKANDFDMRPWIRMILIILKSP